MGTLTVFNADNGTDGASCTAATLPALAMNVVGASAYIKFDSAANLTSGTLGYHFQLQSGGACFFQPNITDSKVQAFRGSFRMLSLPAAAARRIIQWRSDVAVDPDVLQLRISTAGVLEMRDTNGTLIGTGPTLSVGTDYDIGVNFTVGSSTNDGIAAMRVYNKGSATVIGSASASGVDLGASAIGSAYVGANENGAANMEYYWDTLRFENDRTTEFPPHTALTYFDAENGVHGQNITTGTFPGTGVTINASSSFTYDASAAMWGRQGYHVLGASAERSFVTFNLAASSRQVATRFGFKSVQAASANDRPIGYWGSASSSSVFGMYQRGANNNRVLRFFNGAGLSSNSPLAIVPGTEYEVAVNATVGSSTNDGVVTGRIYDKATGTLLDTWGSSTANLQAASAGFDRAQLGCIENVGTAIEYILDSIRYADQTDVLPGPTAASTTIPLQLARTMGAVVVPKIASPKLSLSASGSALLGLEE